jgi:hypothetical protein
MLVPLKDLVDIITALVAIAVFIFGLLKFIDATAIRRYEKFREMSVRFDDNMSIQAVCRLLNGDTGTLVSKQQKEVFLCFLEEISFMVASKIMRKEVALYTFGYYARLAAQSAPFWEGLDKGEPFYSRFLKFCEDATTYKPSSKAGDFTF